MGMSPSHGNHATATEENVASTNTDTSQQKVIQSATLADGSYDLHSRPPLKREDSEISHFIFDEDIDQLLHNDVDYTQSPSNFDYRYSPLAFSKKRDINRVQYEDQKYSINHGERPIWYCEDNIGPLQSFFHVNNGFVSEAEFSRRHSGPPWPGREASLFPSDDYDCYKPTSVMLNKNDEGTSATDLYPLGESAMFHRDLTMPTLAFGAYMRCVPTNIVGLF